MRPIAELPIESLRALRGIFFDIDDTLTTSGRLTAEAYTAVQRLHDARLLVVPITGRPAGWCDHIARMWPVDGVIGENGALYFRYDPDTQRMTRRFMEPRGIRTAHKARLAEIAREIVQACPGCALAADQPYRETDLAIDFCEDVKRLSSSQVDAIVGLMRDRGLTAKVSSIHVNGWFGAYDKLTMTKLFIQECYGVELDQERERFAFIGDSPNDAPMFEYFPLGIGVANVRDFGSHIAHEPTYVTVGSCGTGFREAADCILDARQAPSHNV